MGRKNYIVTATDQAGMPFAELADRLREAGFEVAQELEAIGVILGHADDTNIARLRALRGVAAIEEERSIGPWLGDKPT